MAIAGLGYLHNFATAEIGGPGYSDGPNGVAN